jgi:hypothetical protein
MACRVANVDTGLVKRSMSYTEALTVELSRAVSSTICHFSPTVGFQKVPEVALVLLEMGMVDGGVPGDGVEPPPSFRPTPRPTPKAMTITNIVAQDRIQTHFERRDTHDGDMVVGFRRRA